MDEQIAEMIHAYSYAMIGGMAVQRWGEPRFTQDVDVTVAAPPDDLEGFVRAIVARFTSRVEDAVTFARRTENPELLERFETPWRKIQSVDS